MQPTLDALPPMVIDAYKSLSPDGPDHLPIVFDKIARLWTTEPTHELEELALIKAPTLVMMAETDVPTVEHAAAMTRSIPDAHLAVIPGADHMVMFQKPHVVNTLFLDFFADEPIFSEGPSR
jgi:pimeloyl-ACP methyl ester carboxylesterase